MVARRRPRTAARRGSSGRPRRRLLHVVRRRQRVARRVHLAGPSARRGQSQDRECDDRALGRGGSSRRAASVRRRPVGAVPLEVGDVIGDGASSRSTRRSRACRASGPCAANVRASRSTRRARPRIAAKRCSSSGMASSDPKAATRLPRDRSPNPGNPATAVTRSPASANTSGSCAGATPKRARTAVSSVTRRRLRSSRTTRSPRTHWAFDEVHLHPVTVASEC